MGLSKGWLLYEALDTDHLQLMYSPNCIHIPNDARRRTSTLNFFIIKLFSNLLIIKQINDLDSDHLIVARSSMIKMTVQKIRRLFFNFNRAHRPCFASLTMRWYLCFNSVSYDRVIFNILRQHFPIPNVTTTQSFLKEKSHNAWLTNSFSRIVSFTYAL